MLVHPSTLSLYAQVHQADDAGMRNLLIDNRYASPRADRWTRKFQPPRAGTGTRDVSWVPVAGKGRATTGRPAALPGPEG